MRKVCQRVEPSDPSINKALKQVRVWGAKNSDTLDILDRIDDDLVNCRFDDIMDDQLLGKKIG